MISQAFILHSNIKAAGINIGHAIQGVMHGPSGSVSPGSLTEMQILRLHLRPVESEPTLNMLYR